MEDHVKKSSLITLFLIGALSIVNGQASEPIDSTSIRYNELVSAWTYPEKTKQTSMMYQRPIYNPSHLPIFCKMEYLIQKKSQIPVKIRLGDVEYVDFLESKD